MSKLFLIPTTLSNEINHNALLPTQIKQIQHLKYFIVETAKVARQHLKQLDLDTPIQELNLQELNKHEQDLNTLIKPLLDGHDVGLLSDCGAPAIADPGSQVVQLAHQHGVIVIPLVGPCSIILALMASGANGQSFCFNGYLPIDSIKRREKLKHLQNLILEQQQSQIFIETPFRNQQLFSSLLEQLRPDIVLTIAINLMHENQQILSHPVKQWQKIKSTINLHKQEVIFVLG
jgi:16S rRNA (cytidine1402-2'-O)-methyltransferase